MISTDLRDLANVLAAKDYDDRPLSPDECFLLARNLYALANRVATMENHPIPEFKRRSWPGRPGLSVIDGGAT